MFLGQRPSRTSNPERKDERQPLLRETSSEGERDDDTDNAKAWLVALGIFFINFTIQGMGRIAGILYIDFMNVFHVNREVASEPYSVQQSIRMLAGIFLRKYQNCWNHGVILTGEQYCIQLNGIDIKNCPKNVMSDREQIVDLLSVVRF